MTIGMTRALLAGIAGAFVFAAAAQAQTMPVRLLSPEDRLTYTTAFDALSRGDLELARRTAQVVQDRVLLGRLEFERLFHPDHSATYDELSAWLETYADLPEAPRAYSLALRRKPDGAPDPTPPSRGRTWTAMMSGGGRNMEHDPARAARVALNNERFDEAVEVGAQIGDWWTVALANYRLGRFTPSYEAFRRVAEDPTEDPWIRAGAAVWAAKAAEGAARLEEINPMLRLAAQWPATFYGQIALHRLGETPMIENLGPRPYQPQGELRRAAYRPTEAQAEDIETLSRFVRDEPVARRAVALMEVGRRSEAQTEVRRGLRTAIDDGARALWTRLAEVMGARPRDADARTIDATLYPMPMLEPEGGFVVERALVYALARKETGFDPSARSSVGAYGIMQVMPYTASELTGDAGFRAQPDRLLVPATNLRIGQMYLQRMLGHEALQGDLLRVVASYNAGPGPMIDALRKLGPDPDPLLLIETIDVPQARDYVEKVVSAYWIYQRMMGGPLNTLDAAAKGAPRVPLQLDFVPPPPVQMADAPTATGAP